MTRAHLDQQDQTGGSFRRARGVRCLADLRDRCRIDDDTGCWVWSGAVKGGERSGGRPEVRIDGKAFGLSKLLHRLLNTPAKDERGLIYHPMCSNKRCCNPGHHKLLTKSEINELRGGHTALTRARISAVQRAAGRSRLSEEQRAEILGSPLKLSEIMERYGVSLAYASGLRSGKAGVPRGRQATAPRLAAGASVFAIGVLP